MIRKSYAALRNFETSLPNPNPNLMLSGQIESESEKTGSDPHHCIACMDMQHVHEWTCDMQRGQGILTP